MPLTQDDASTLAASTSASASGGASVDNTSSKFEWRVVPSVIPGLWDPRILRSQHIAVTVKPVPAPASAWTVDDVLAQACVPLRELCDALGAFVRGCRDGQPTASRDPVDELVGSLPLDAEDMTVSSEPSWLIDAVDKQSLVYKQPGVPFSVPLMRRGQAIGTLEVRIRLVFCS